MARGRKRDGVNVTVTPMATKKAKTTAQKTYRSRKSISTKVSENASKRTVTMPYTASSTFAMTANTVHSTVLNANDIFTTQPMGRDQMFGFFDKAYVKSASLEVFFHPTMILDGVKAGYVAMNVWCDTNSSGSGSIVESHQRCLAHGGKHVEKQMFVSAANPSTIVNDMLYIKMDPEFTKKITGHGFESDELSQTNTAAPENKWYWHIEKYQNYDANAITPVQNYATMQEAVFYDPKELAVS